MNITNSNMSIEIFILVNILLAFINTVWIIRLIKHTKYVDDVLEKMTSILGKTTKAITLLRESLC